MWFKVETVESNPDKQEGSDVTAENKPEKDGIGQAQTEENVEGHSGETDEHFVEQETEKHNESGEKKRRPGESDSDRALGTNPVISSTIF